jgi:hypothetical protein
MKQICRFIPGGEKDTTSVNTTVIEKQWCVSEHSHTPLNAGVVFLVAWVLSQGYAGIISLISLSWKNKLGLWDHNIIFQHPVALVFSIYACTITVSGAPLSVYVHRSYFYSTTCFGLTPPSGTLSLR